MSWQQKLPLCPTPVEFTMPATPPAEMVKFYLGDGDR
jgi:hypothetical protein